MFKSCFWDIGSDSHFLAIAATWGSEERVLVLHLMLPHRISRMWQCVICGLRLGLGRHRNCVRARCSSGFQTAHRKTCQLHLPAKQLDNQTEHLVSVLVLFLWRGGGRLVMNSNLYMHFCGLKWKDHGRVLSYGLFVLFCFKLHHYQHNFQKQPKNLKSKLQYFSNSLLFACIQKCKPVLLDWLAGCLIFASYFITLFNS